MWMDHNSLFSNMIQVLIVTILLTNDYKFKTFLCAFMNSLYD
jgi:hypothetical protein